MKNSFETWLPRLVVTPAFVLGFAFIYGLMVWNGVLSLTASRMLPNYEWAGLAQYERLWEMDRWWVALKNLGIFGVGYVGGSLVIGVVLAVLLDQKIRAEGALRTIYLYPMALSFVVTGTAWKWLLNPGLGIEKMVDNIFADALPPAPWRAALRSAMDLMEAGQEECSCRLCANIFSSA